jgi:hypothetical protein
MAIIDKPEDYFNTLLYTGDDADRSFSGVGFQPDLTWIKARNNTTWHLLYDAVRTAGTGKELHSNSTQAEGASNSSLYGYLSSFDSDGFSTVNGSNATDALNQSGKTYAAWNWKAGGTASSNTDGSITSSVSANTTSGFSIVSYTGNGTGNSTIGHGLGATPKFIIVKNRTTTQDWGTYSPSFVSAADPNVLYLSKTSAQADDTNVWGTSAAFNDNTFTVGDWTGSNQSGSNFIAYCFAEKQGYSKFGSYTGNGNADGPFIYTGFKPAFVMTKNISGINNWTMCDNKRNTFNPTDKVLNPNVSTVEAVNNPQDFVSNGFKNRATENNTNQSGSTYIYMAFAENPFVTSTGVPATAR